MRPILRGPAAIGIAVVLAGCGGGGGGGTTAPVGATGPAATTAGAAPCADSTDPTVVSAAVAENNWDPATVVAAVGDVITWTNADGVPHQVALDDGSCKMSKAIPGGGTGSLVFSTAGTFPFHCSIHSSMKGSFTIS